MVMRMGVIIALMVMVTGEWMCEDGLQHQEILLSFPSSCVSRPDLRSQDLLPVSLARDCACSRQSGCDLLCLTCCPYHSQL